MDPAKLSVEKCFYGSATLGERGQIVIPAEARKDCDFHAGDKLLVFRHPYKLNMLIVAKVGEMQYLLQQIARDLKKAATNIAESDFEIDDTDE